MSSVSGSSAEEEEDPSQERRFKCKLCKAEILESEKEDHKKLHKGQRKAAKKAGPRSRRVPSPPRSELTLFSEIHGDTPPPASAPKSKKRKIKSTKKYDKTVKKTKLGSG